MADRFCAAIFLANMSFHFLKESGDGSDGGCEPRDVSHTRFDATDDGGGVLDETFYSVHDTAYDTTNGAERTSDDAQKSTVMLSGVRYCFDSSCDGRSVMTERGARVVTRDVSDASCDSAEKHFVLSNKKLRQKWRTETPSCNVE
jgi:hypothetical protein